MKPHPFYLTCPSKFLNAYHLSKCNKCWLLQAVWGSAPFVSSRGKQHVLFDENSAFCLISCTDEKLVASLPCRAYSCQVQIFLLQNQYPILHMLHYFEQYTYFYFLLAQSPPDVSCPCCCRRSRHITQTPSAEAFLMPPSKQAMYAESNACADYFAEVNDLDNRWISWKPSQIRLPQRKSVSSICFVCSVPSA